MTDIVDRINESQNGQDIWLAKQKIDSLEGFKESVEELDNLAGRAGQFYRFYGELCEKQTRESLKLCRLRADETDLIELAKKELNKFAAEHEISVDGISMDSLWEEKTLPVGIKLVAQKMKVLEKEHFEVKARNVKKAELEPVISKYTDALLRELKELSEEQFKLQAEWSEYANATEEERQKWVHELAESFMDYRKQMLVLIAEQKKWEVYPKQDFGGRFDDVSVPFDGDMMKIYKLCDKHNCNAFTIAGSRVHLKRVVPEPSALCLIVVPNDSSFELHVRKELVQHVQPGLKWKSAWTRLPKKDFGGRYDVMSMEAFEHGPGDLSLVYEACWKHECNAFCVANGKAYLKRVPLTGDTLVPNDCGYELHVVKNVLPAIMVDKPDSWEKLPKKDYGGRFDVTSMRADNMQKVFEACKKHNCNAFCLGERNGVKMAWLKRVQAGKGNLEPNASKFALYLRKDLRGHVVPYKYFPVNRQAKESSWEKHLDKDFTGLGGGVKKMKADDLEKVYEECEKLDCNAFAVAGGTAYLKRMKLGGPNKVGPPNSKPGCDLYLRHDIPPVFKGL